MNITIKQLMDIVSLSIEAVNSKTDPTVLSPKDKESFYPNGNSTSFVTPIENEIGHILSFDQSDDSEKEEIANIAYALNEHIAAIRLGMRLSNQQSEDF